MKFVPTLLACTIAGVCTLAGASNELKNFNRLALLPQGANSESLVKRFDSLTSQAPVGVAKAAQQNQIAAENHLRNLVALSALTQAQLAGVELQHVHDTGRGAIIARFAQRLDGVRVFGSDFALVMDREYRLLATSGQLSAQVAPQQNNKARANAFAFPIENAVDKAFAELGGKARTISVATSKMADRMAFAIDSDNAVQLQQASAERIYFATPDSLIPAYKLELQTTISGTRDHQGYAFIYSAQDGQLLFRMNQIQSEKYAYRVFADSDGQPWDGPQGRDGHPHPTGIKGQNYQPTFKAPNLVVLENSPFSRNDPWLPANSTETLGNNVDAYVDQFGNDGFQTGDIRGVVNGLTANNEKTFDYVLNTSIVANANDDQKRAAAVEMFYMINWLHDWFYDHGFDEAAGNAQDSNFGRGGMANDALMAEAQDQSGFNNANMYTPSDGNSPTMQMYLYAFAGDSKLAINNPGGMASIDTTTAGFGPPRFSAKTADLVLVQDGVVGSNAETGAVGTVNDGCEPFTTPANYTNKIVLVERGLCNFTVKVKNAQNAGAIAAVVYNNRAEAMIALGGDDDTITIPAVGISQSDGNTLKALTANVTVTEPNPSRDSSFDALTIAHEWGHYITNRMIGNSAGLQNNQGRSMGEGWGDFHALLLTVEAQDATATAAGWDAKWSMGGYSDQGVAANDTYFIGIRGFPYTTDMDATNGNNLTFAHIKVDPEYHGSGTFWATVLWDCYVTLLKNHSFSEAQTRMKDYLIASYAATPNNPTFTEARDALLAVVTAADAQDAQRMKVAFARRGMGVGAVSPGRFDELHSDVVESFVVSAPAAPAAATVLPLQAKYTIVKGEDSVSIPVHWTAPTGANVTSYALVINNVAQPSVVYTPSDAAIDLTTNYVARSSGSLKIAVRLCNGPTCVNSAVVNTSVKKQSSGSSGGGGGSMSWLFALLAIPLMTRRRQH